jgi:hypothetical protein
VRPVSKTDPQTNILYALSILAQTCAILVLAILVAPSAAVAQPWEYRCRSAISNVESAASDAERARRSAEDAYERYKQAKEDYESCRRWDRDCDWRRWDAESARSSAESDITTFNSRLRSLTSSAEDVKSACAADAVEVPPAVRICRLVQSMRRRSEQEALDFCRRVRFPEEQCRRCMQQ